MFLKKILIISLLFSTFCNAMDVSKTAILVNDTDGNDPLKFKQAYAQILANNSGERISHVIRSVDLSLSTIKPGIKRSYFEKVETQFLSGSQTQKFWFHLVMKNEFIQNQMNQAGFSVLPHNREKIMLWAVKEETVEGQSKITPLEENDTGMYWIKRWADALTLEIQLPNWDSRDKSKVSMNSVKSMRNSALDQSSNRYQINQSLLIYIRQGANSSKIRSGFAAVGQDIAIKYYQQPNKPLGEILYSVMENTSAKYAKIFKVAANSLEKHTVQIIINELDNYDEANSINQYLSHLSVIDSYMIVAANVGQLVITAELRVSTQAFLQIISRDNLLMHNPEGSINQLVFTSTR